MKKFHVPTAVRNADAGNGAGGDVAAETVTSEAGAAEGDAGSEGNADADNQGGDDNAEAQGQDQGDGKEDQTKEGGEDGEGQPEPLKAEDYEINYGEGVEIDPAKEAAFRNDLAELGVSQESAAQVVELHKRYLKREEQGRQQWIEGMQAEVRNDPELGGASYDQSMSYIAVARDKFLNEGARQLLEDTGLAHHKDMFRLLRDLGKELSEDNGQGARGSGVGGAAEQSGVEFMAERFPNAKK